MRLVLGGLNQVRLTNLMREAAPYCAEVEAAVAYASDGELVDFCVGARIPLTYFGLLDEDGEGVSLPLLRRFIELSSTDVRCRLVCGNYHPKVIWWHGYGAYIGSANLTTKAWWRNVECGVFFSDAELVGQGLVEDMERLFAYLEEVSTPLKSEILDALQKLDQSPAQRDRERKVEALQRLLGALPRHGGLDRVPPRGERPSRRKKKFIGEWNATLQLLRDLGARLAKDGRRPEWLPMSEDIAPAVHCDQMLHAYYYEVVLKGADEGRSAEKVERSHEANKNAPLVAFGRAIDWWVGLATPPHGEDVYILESAPRLAEGFSQEAVGSLNAARFGQLALFINAFRTHARQVENSEYGLPADHRETEEERTLRLASRVWVSKSAAGRTFPELLSFVLYGANPGAMEERIWAAVHDPGWMIDHFKLSSIGELVGWVLPRVYPPRNNRTNKALRALGFPVTLYHD